MVIGPTQTHDFSGTITARPPTYVRVTPDYDCSFSLHALFLVSCALPITLCNNNVIDSESHGDLPDRFFPRRFTTLNLIDCRYGQPRKSCEFRLRHQPLLARGFQFFKVVFHDAAYVVSLNFKCQLKFESFLKYVPRYPTHMSYADVVKHLHKKAGLSIKDYAERVGYSTAQVSLVLNGHQDGTLKMVEACVRYAGQDIEEYLWIPESAEAAVERKALHAFKSLNEKNRDFALRFLENMSELQDAKEKRPNKRS